MPNGGGKSRCYQVPSLCLEGLTVVISPLTSLMQDQLASLHDVDVKASAMYTSSISDLERANILHALGYVQEIYRGGYTKWRGWC